MTEDSLTVARWTRYGKDRLYVTAANGERVGWHNLLTGQDIVERPELIDAFHQALRAYQRAQEQPGQVGATPSPAEATKAPPDWTDLALNRPGQGARAEAEARLAVMRSNSKLKTFVARALDTKTDERAFRVGADGEESVGARLDRLTKHGAYVLHSIPVGSRGSDIDHLVITKGGVYPVNTKRHPGGKVWVGGRTIMVNGQKTDYLRNSRFEAERVRKVLMHHLGVEVPVKAVLVFLTGTVLPQVTIKQMPDDVLVLDRMDLPRVLKKSPVRMTEEMMEQVFEVARRSTTWL